MNIQLENTTKKYRNGEEKKAVLNDISLDLPSREITAILGPSGSGKSTLLHIIGGLEKVSSGKIFVDNVDITSISNKKIIEYRREKVGFIFQFYNLVPNLTVKENVEICANLTKDPLNIDEILKDVGLYEHRNKVPSQLSGGQQQRCSLARAVVKKPKLLLCDEPTGALDSEASYEVLKILEKMHKLYKTEIIIVTHNIEIAKMCNRVIEIKDGKITANRVNEDVIPACKLKL